MLTITMAQKADISTQTVDPFKDSSSELENRFKKIEAEIENSKKYKITEVAALSFITYGVCSSVFLAIGNDSPLLNAFIPTTGFIISTFVKDKVLTLFQRAKSCLNCFGSSKNEKTDIAQIV